MQTFLPYPSFTQSALVLDNQRLGKQRVEALQILRCLVGLNSGWQYHPAVKQWRGYESALVAYQHAIVQEWLNRGYRDTCWEKTLTIATYTSPVQELYVPPSWLGDPAYHRSHQSNLIRKRPDIYRLLWPLVPDNLPYVWPV